MSKRQQLFSAVVIIIFLCLVAPMPVTGQQDNPSTPPPSAEPDSYSTWAKKQVEDAMKTVAPNAAVAQNGNGVSNQVESPSADQASTSLVDTSSASDFASMALSLAGISAKNEDNSTPTSGSVTATLYSLLAAVKGVPITDPKFYKEGTRWRRLAFTVGSENSVLEKDFSDKPSTNVGAKLLIINYRDIYSTNGQDKIKKMEASLGEFQRIELAATDGLQCVIFKGLHPGGSCGKDDKAFQQFLLEDLGPEKWPSTRKAIEDKASTMEEVGRFIAEMAAGRKVASDTISMNVEEIQRARQLSVAYYTKQREGEGTDEHRAELIFDYGFNPRLNWTINASFDYLDRKTSKDSREGRIATELQAKLGNPGGGVWKARPVTLSASGEATRESGAAWLVQAQVKLLFPITTGVDVPIAYTYANRSSNGVSAGSRLKISLAVDPVRFREWLTSSAEQRHGN